ncbi:MAG: pyrophosphate--fructose-6-phosphate 1-phosphotransferase [Opitutales bacterium]|nr:pyrophosphate--fructose-6-phosphate 1-phosphotransferase [Opitutales bacterium]
MTMAKKKVGILTAGGLAPCLSSAVGGLIERYSEIDPSIEIICYTDGYKGLLLGEFLNVGPEERREAGVLHRFGGSPIGNSRVKLTNVKDCVKRGLVKEGEDPLQVAAERLKSDGVSILHTIGGDDTNTTAADLASFLKENAYDLTVVGLPKTIDNDVIPIRQSLGAWTAAEQGAKFFANVVAEHNANPRMLIVHEVMGRNCGWLTAATARAYRQQLAHKSFVSGLGLAKDRLDVHGIYLPEMELNIEEEAQRLHGVMDRWNCVNLFISEGAGVDAIIAEREAAGEELPRDAFGHVRLDAVNPGKWFAEQFAQKLDAEKVLVQKSGYFARSAPANVEDLRLIKGCVDLAVEVALRGESGVIGHDEEQDFQLRAIEFDRIKGGKAFDFTVEWCRDLFDHIGQRMGKKVETSH